MNFLRQILALCQTHFRLWWRRPLQWITSILLCSAYLLVGTQLLNVQIGNRIHIGLYSKGSPFALDVERELNSHNISTVRYEDYSKGVKDLEQGKIVAFVAFGHRQLHLALSGRNPLLDRELDGLLLRIATRVTSRVPQAGRIVLNHDRHTSEDMTTFMTASLIPFLIMALAMVNCGMHWLRDWEDRTVFSFLATPASRVTLLTARTLSGSVLALLILLISLAVSRLFITWYFPSNILFWLAIILLQIFFAVGFFFALAAICRRYILYVDVSMLIVILLMFASATIKPLESMAQWECVLAWCTPAFYAVRSMRAVMLGAEPLRLLDICVLASWGIACYAIGYAILVRSRISGGAR
jgi:ABC-type multidrug transport system permease subunit